MKVNIYADTPDDYGMYVTTVERSCVEDVLFELRMQTRDWRFYAILPLTNNKAIGRVYFSHELETEDESEIGPASVCCYRKGNRRPPFFHRTGAEEAEPEVSSQALCAAAHQPGDAHTTCNPQT